MTEYLWWGNGRVTPHMHKQLSRLDADLRALFGVGLVVKSGIRLPQEQIDVFLERYVTAGNVRGRRVYDTRWWRGQLWYRVSAAGTVAVPGTSNHEIQGNRAAVDIADTGRDAGVASRYSQRGQWIRRNAPNYDLVASGDGFAEGWHFDVNNIFAAVNPVYAGEKESTLPTNTTKKEKKPMRYLFQLDPNSDGRWVVACISEGWYHPISNGWQLDRVREETRTNPAEYKELSGAQPVSSVAGLRAQ